MTQPPAPAHDVFISYSSLDKPIADAVCATLEARRVRCWIAPRDAQLAGPYAGQLTDAIQQSCLLVLVLSSRSNNSYQILREVEAAVTQGLPVVLLRVEDVELSRSLRSFLKAVPGLDALTPPVEQHLSRLADTVRLFLARPGPDEPAGVFPDRKPAATPQPAPKPKGLLLAGVVACVVLLGLLGLWASGVFKGTTKDGIKAGPEVQLPLPQLTNSIGMRLVLIPAGTFRMGSPNDEQGRFKWEGPQHEVEITRPFYLGAHEVTVGQFGTFVRDTSSQTEAEKDGKGGWGLNAHSGKFEQKPEYTWRNPGFAQIDEHPVVNVSWNDAVAFCAWLSKKEGKPYSLPTEAQWEYSCRAGSATRFCFGNEDAELGQYAWTVGNSGWKTHPVGEKRANAWGLFDMHGNAWEWCQDWYATDYYQESPTQDPTGPSAGAARLIRGGSWFSGPRYCRAANRYGCAPWDRVDCLGFRVLCVR